MAAYNEEDVQWLYGRMVDDGVDAGTIDDFKKSLKNDADRDWYFKRAKKMGLEVGDADEFRSWTVPEEEPYSWEYKAMTPGDKVEQRTMTAPAQDEEETPSIAGGAAAVGEAGAAAVNRVAKPKPKPKQQKHGAVADWRFRAGMRLAGVNPDNPADNRVSRMQAPRTKPLKAAKRDIAKPTMRINEESGRVEQVSTAQEQRRLAAEILQDPNTIVNQMTNNGGSVEQIKAEMPEHYTWLQNRMGENTDDFLDETIMWKSLEPSMEKIFEEETAAREKREGHTEEDDWGIGVTSVIPGDPNFSLKVALGIARNELGDMEGTHKRMVDRLLSENPAAQRWLEKRAREILKDNTDLYNYCVENNIQPGQSIGPGLPPLPVVITKPPTLLGSREQAKDELLKMFQGRTIQHLAPKNDWQWGTRSFFGNNMWGSLASAAVGVGSGKYEAQQLNEAAMADYEKERAGWVAQVTTPALTLGADILTGGFEIPGLASKGATMLGERLMVTAGKRALGIAEKETAKRAVLHTGNSALLKMLGTGANFGVYDAMSTSLHGLATDTFDWGDTAEAGLKGGFKGFVFGGVGFLGETATKGLTGWKTVLGEAGTLAGETATFAAMDYFQTGELTPVTIGRAFGMSLAGRASHPAQYAADFMARYTGEKWKYMVKQAPTINKDTRDMLVNSGYKNMAEFLYNSQTARNVWRALRGKKAVDEGWAQNYLDTLKNELDLMKNDPSVDWNTIRKAEYVLNGRIMPEATAVNYTMRYVDSQAYGVTLDSTGHEINRYKLKSQKAIDEWKSATSQKCDENLLMLANETYKYDVSRAAFFYAVMRAADEYGVTMDEALGYYNRHESGGISHTVAERIDQLYRREMERDRRPELVEKVEEKYGVDIDEVMKIPMELRASNEEKAFRELCERLSGTYNTDLDKSTEELIQDQKEQAHDEGVQAEGEQRAELKERLEDAVRELERLGIDPARIDGMDDAAMARWMEENGMDAEKAVAVQEYMSAKAAFEGIRDRVQDESRKRIEESNKQTDERTNSDTGGIHPVKMKEGGEEGRDAFVIKGKITVNQDGTIDTARSDKDITVFYPDTGEKKVMTIADVKSGEPTIDPEQAKQDAAQQITEEVAGQAADDMNRTLKFNQDDTFNVLVDGKEVELKVVGVDPESGNPILEDRQGRRAPAIPEMVQQMHDEWREWKRNGGEPAVEDGERGVDSDAAPKVEETPAEEQGPAVMPAPGQSEPRDMVDYLYRKSGMSEKSADNAVRNNLRVAAEKVEKAVKERDENTDPDIQKAIDLDKAVEDAKNELAYWHGVQAERMRERAEQRPAKAEEPLQSNGTENQPAEERLRMTAEGIDPDGEYSGFGMSPETVEALDNGSGIVRLVDALAKELGIKVRTFKGSKDAPGYTDPNTGIIWLNTNREDGGFRQTLGHELLHGLKQEAKRQGKPELYTALRDAVLDYVKKQKGDGYEDYYDSMLNRYQNGLYKYGFQQAMDRGASATQANQEGWAHRANVDKDYIEEEIVCDAIGDLIDGDTESASRMLEGIKDKKLLQSIKDYFLDLLKRVKASFKRGDNAKPTPEELAIDRVIENFEKMYKDLIKGRRAEMRKEEAGAVAEDEGVHSIEQAAAQDGKLFSFKNEDDLQNKLRKYAKTTDGKRLKWNAEKINEVISETADLIRAVHAALNGDPFYNEFAAKDPTIRLDWRDGEEHPVVTWSRNNVEYKYDMSADLLCVNNDGLEEVLSSPKMCDLMVKMFENEIARNGGKTYTIKTETDKETGEVKEKKEYFAGGFTSEDYINLYNMLRDMGFVVPCRGCFDAAARLKMLPSVSQKFENQVNDIIGERAKDPEAYDAALREEGRQAQIKENERARRKGEKPKRKVGANGFPLAAPTKEVAIRVAVAADNLTEPITYSQLMSAQGQTEMLSDWGSIFRAWQRTGAGRPKDKLMPEPYTGDITSSTYTIIGPADKRTPNFRDKEVNQGTSLRRNSHSELRPYLIVDEIQFMRDAFVRNLCVFKYMKELDDVRLFGQMGVKFNMSFFPAHDKAGVASGLDANGDYTAAEESVGAREFPYVGADGKTHYDGLRGWAEAQKYCNDDVSLSTVIFSMPHMVKVLTDVPTPDDPSGKWGSAIPFHASGATAKQLFLQGLGRARAIDSDHPFEQEAYTDWEKGVTNFEQVQNDRFGKGWVAVGGKKDGKDMFGHKLEFATSGHYYNAELGLHMVRGGLITDEAWPNMKFNKDGTLNKKALKGVEGFIPMDIDYNNKVRELKSKYGYKEASDYYIQFMQEHGIIPRFHFNVPEEAFLRMCEAAHVDPHHPKLGWKGEGNGWSPIDSPAYYSMFCDYGMTKADGTWSPQRPVGVLNEHGEREFRMPANTVDIATEAMRRYTERRLTENAKVDDAISNFADMMVEQGKVSRQQADEALAKTTFDERDSRAIEAGEEQVRFSLSDGDYNQAVEAGDQKKIDKMVRDAAKAAGMATDESGKLIDLYHGTDKFGFTIFDRLKSRMGAFFTSTRRNVAANYAGDDHYAGVRKINKGYKQDDSQEGILNNARSVFDQDWKMATEEQKQAIVTKVEADARKVADEIDKRRVDAETLPADEDLDIFNATAWVMDLFYTVAYAKENGNEGEDLYRLVADGVERYNENKQVIRDYVSKHYDELDEKQKNYLNYLTGWDSGDVAIDIECSYMRVVSGKDLATVTGNSMLTLDELKKNTDEAHNIGAYHLYGNLGDNPLIVDAEGKNWYSLEYEGRKFDTDTLAQYAKENGYTALVVKNVYDYGDKADDYIFFEPSQLKSADPATYDDNGNLIPLSERFNLGKKDIRFSLSDDQREAQTHSDNFKRWFGDWENDPENASKVVDEAWKSKQAEGSRYQGNADRARLSVEVRDGLMGEANALQKVPGRELQPRAENLGNIRFSLSKSTRGTIEQWFSKRDDLSDDQKEAVMQYLDEFNDKKLQLSAARWYVNGTVRLPEDMPKVEQAMQVANKVKVDPLQYSSPMELINQFPQTKIKAKRIDPETVPTLHNGRDIGHGLRIYDVEESEESRQNMRQIINTHFGEDASPWCLLQGDGHGNLTVESRDYWDSYDAYPKRVAFKDGKLIAFSANDYDEITWWDRMDEPHRGIKIEEAVPNDKLGRKKTAIIDADDGTVSYDSDNMFRGNKQNGTYEEWDSKGVLIVREQYKDGKEDGISEVYDSNGDITSRTSHKEGKLDGLSEDFYQNGKVRSRRTFKDGELDGLCESFWPDGKRKIRQYKKGRWNVGDYEEWYDNGQLKVIRHYDAHYNEIGVWLEYNQDGQIIERTDYSGGKKNRVFEQYDSKDGKVHRAYYRNGLIEEMETWNNGILEEHDEWSDSENRFVSTDKKPGLPPEGFPGESNVRFSLAPEQREAQTHSENFKRWFGDWESDPENASKVVDEEGKPLVMTHNTDQQFTIFDRGRIGTGQGQAYIGLGFNFSRGRNSTYGGNAMEVYLNARNPLQSDGHKLTASMVEQALRKIDEGQEDTTVAEFAGEFVPYGTPEYDRAVRKVARDFVRDYDDLSIYSSISVISSAEAETVIEAFKELGFDSTIERDSEGRIMNAVVFDPNQVKSATENNGEFSRENPDIRFSLSEEDRDYMDAVEKSLDENLSVEEHRVAVEDIQRMLGKAFMDRMGTELVKEDGMPLTMWHTTPNEFTVFDKDRLGENTDRNASNEDYAKTAHVGFWTNTNWNLHDKMGFSIGSNSMPLFVVAKKPLRFNSLRELATELSNYTSGEDFAEKKKNEGYDSVILNDEEFGGVSCIAFDSNQLKSAALKTYDNDGNLIPLSQRFDEGKKDIRFSLSEESQKVFDTAKRKFGETQDIREAGYVLPDGTMLDFSGRHELDPGSDSSHLAGRRHTDHRAVNQIDFVYDENGDEVDTGVNSDMPDFIKRGAIRIDNNAGLINLSTKPTAGQRKVLRQLVAENGGTVDVDFGDGWDTDYHVEYNNAKATRVLGDIDRYFDEGIKPQSNVRFSLADTFYSNAARAVEGVKQEKAKAEQWKAMLTKAGGIKAGEDKWMGLSTWLDEHKGETLTKDEVAQFVAENGIQMEEVNYGDKTSEIKKGLDDFANEFDSIVAQKKEEGSENDVYDEAFADMVEKYGEDFDMAFMVSKTNFPESSAILVPVREYGGELSDAAKYFLGVDNKEDNLINKTRLDYTTPGLENKREIAFVVPGVEPYQEHDEIHFGPENQGRAVMWVRFGETTDTEGNRVLVIDEIQSNRHQDAREKGYKNTQERTKRVKDIEKEIAEFEKRQKEILEPIINSDKYKGHITQDGENGDYMWGEFWEERKQIPELADIDSRLDELYQEKGRLTHGRFSGIPDAPFEKNWHEVAMKRMLRLAAEEGFDKVAWTTGEQQSERYGLGGRVEKIGVSVEDGFRWVEIDYKNGNNFTMNVEPDGTISLGPEDMEEEITNPLHGKHVEEVFGKEMAEKILNVEKEANFSGDGLKIGGEGMKGFYDQMLPQFMNKYGKRWGVKVGEVTLNTPGKETMHSVDVNEDMKRSVMQGQPLFSLSLGAPYQGSKGQIATSVVDRLPKGKRFVDLFSGGGAMTHAAMLSGKYEGYRMNDINPAGQDLFLGGMRGDYRDYTPREMTDEEFKAIKGTPEGLMLSYGGLGRNIDNNTPTRDRSIRRVQRLEALKPYADKVEASNTDYREVQLRPGDVVYADIPYEGTNKTGYREGAKFDKQAFSEWGLEQDVPIYVSEQSMPEGWAEVASWNMRAMRGKQRDEKLFVQEKFADQVRDEIAQYPNNTDGPKFQLTEDIENYQPRDVSWERAMLDRLMETAGRNREAVDKRRDALRTLNSQAGALRRAMSRQREYDRWTVDDLVSMAKSMLKSGLYKGMSPYEVQRLVGMINQGAGREDITRQANAVFDLMMKHHVKEWENQFNKLLRIRENKIDKNGVRVQGALDPKGQRMVKALRDGITLSKEALEDRIWDCRDRMGSDDPVVAGNAADEYEGLIHAQQHYDNIGRLNEALEELRHERRTQLERVYEYWREERVDDYGNVIYRQDGEPSTVEKRRVRPEFGGVDENGNRLPVSEENKAIRKQVDATVASIEQAMRETEVELAEGYRSLCDNVGGSVAGSITRAKEWVESEKDRVSEIQHAANSDLLNTEEKLSGMDRSKEKGIANNAVVRFINSPLGSFEKFMRYFGQRSAYGEGRLYNKFMRGHSDCTDAEWRAYKEGLDAMNQKSEELFGCSWEKLMVKMRGGAFANTKGKLGIDREFPPIEVSYWVDGKRVDDTLNQDEVAYLIACSKMTDGMMKLENMGIDENMIAQLRQQVDPRMLQLADWYQHEFLPKQRTRINEVYKRMFGADMAHIDNYIHLNINERGLVENKDINQRMAASETPSTITGSLKERKRNTKPIDLHTSILDLALEEHQKMENWIAWAEYNRDLKDLLNYKKFKNKVYNMKSVELGSGEQLWDKFSKAVAVVTGDFQGGGKHSEMDRFATNAAKFVSSGCINFRVHTALKQVLSFPAFMSDARPGDILFAAGNAMGSVQWAMENLPGFSKRWESRRVGDTRLMDTDSDYSFWRNRWVKKVNKAGMTANASVDCLTVAIGARAVYETAKRRYLSYGYNEKQAERKALQDAYVSYNSSQQSSEGAFVSPMQVERTFLSAIGTTFRNASMGYQRRVTTGARNIARMRKKGYKEDMIENTKKQMMEEGLSEEQAQRAAERVYNRQLWHSMMDVANFGYALPFLWILGPTLSYLIAGDDDKIKKDTLADLARHAMFGPIEGLTFGGVMSELGNMVLNNRIQGKEWKDLWNELKNKDLTPLPLVSRMQGLFDSFGKGWWEGINDFTGLLIQSGIGVDPNTLTDVGVAILDACNGDLDTSKEVALGLMRILQFPQSQIDNLYIDELGLNGKDLGKYSYEELARRYARYKTNRAVLPTVMRSDEANDAAEEKVMKRFEAKVQERLDAMDADQLGEVFDSGDPDLKKIIGAKVAKDAGLKNERYSKKPDADAKPETAKATEAYQNKRNWGDISEDILLQQAKAGATADGDDERAKKIEKALSAITKLRNGDPEKGIKGMGVDKKTDERILKEIRETRSKALKELKISR